MAKITVKDTEVVFYKREQEDFISLTDMAKYKDSMEPSLVISHWMSTRYTVDFMGIWESVNNPDFKPTEFGRFKMASGSNGFILTPKRWVEATNAIGIFSKAGRYGGGTFAHKDIAFEFASWLSPEFKYLLIVEFQRLKEDEQKAIGWTAKRELAKINYHIHTSAVSRNLVPKVLSKEQINFIYASEADVLNVAMFGMTAKEWREANPDLKGNIRDYATVNELICLSNMENLNAVFINEGFSQSERLEKLNQIAIQQMSVLENIENRKLLK